MFKVNTNGSLLGNLGRVGGGGLIRDDKSGPKATLEPSDAQPAWWRSCGC